MHEHSDEEKILLPHHEQQSLCTARLPYRQGRKLTAVKVYSISKESNHMLIFGVPSLNLRQETKALFIKFGKLLQFNISKEHACESFTDTYHAQYDKIQSARLAKRMLDTKNFYGGTLHVCYAPELESINETRQKLIQRQRDVIFRLKNLSNDKNNATPTPKVSSSANVADPIKLNMGEVNTIHIKKQTYEVVRKKRKITQNRKFEACFIDKELINISHDSKVTNANIIDSNNVTISNLPVKYGPANDNINGNGTTSHIAVCTMNNDIDVIDCTGVDKEVVTNINECLNYNKFGNEIIREIPQKAPNKIQFHINKKS